MLLETFTRVAQAVFLGYLLNYLQGNGNTQTQGYMYALGLSLCVVFIAVIHHIDFFVVTIIIRKCIIKVYEMWDANEGGVHCSHL